MAAHDLFEFNRLKLAQLGREMMLFAQFNSRTGYAALRMNHGDEAYQAIAIDNWMGASPVYTRRMQKAMRFSGDSSVETIFKGLQLECGFTHQYFDVRFAVQSPEQGRFWLKSCGALLETEPRGPDAVKTMCHDIEDPTFNATAVATNPRARMTAIHRPPRVPSDRVPHCEWLVHIDPEALPLAEPKSALAMSETKLACLFIERAHGSSSGGLEDYSGDMHERLHLEQFSQSALSVICRELAVQVHLLIAAMMRSVAEHYGETAALAVAEFQMAGSCWVMSERLCGWLGLSGSGIDDVIRVLEIHPAFQPREYWRLEVIRNDAESARLRVHDCPALQETEGCGWQAVLKAGMTEGLAGLVRGVSRRARVTACGEQGSLCWDICLDGADEEEPLAVQIAKGTVLYQTRLRDRVQLLQM
ncbi:hypothetical protein EYC82_06660 [Halieaceae bacterium IMCC11814]|uniref:Uncharacterized protein n=2 Tax=Candidatus Marimicrobium litorale TaxID=2518991 RepID=A0ABT3T444_9GAMM|nr:hypothetical protein [Candidatus Marimicrobium litorale]